MVLSVAEVEKNKMEFFLFCMNFLNSVRDLVMFMSVYVSHVMSVSQQNKRSSSSQAIDQVNMVN